MYQRGRILATLEQAVTPLDHGGLLAASVPAWFAENGSYVYTAERAAQRGRQPAAGRAVKPVFQAAATSKPPSLL